jgi:hypothetical protein
MQVKGTDDMAKKAGIFEVLGYYFRKPDPTRPHNFNLRAMHTINKISIFMFLVGVIILIVKLSLR